MTNPADQLRAHLNASGLSQRVYARKVLLRNPATLHRWLTGKSPIPAAVLAWLERRKPKNA